MSRLDSIPPQAAPSHRSGAETDASPENAFSSSPAEGPQEATAPVLPSSALSPSTSFDAPESLQQALATRASSGQAVGSLEQAQRVMERVIERSYPELRGAPIVLEESQLGHGTYFTSRPRVMDFWRWLSPFHKADYVLFINPDVFELGLSERAAEAILAHELGHTERYHRGGAPQVVLHGLAELFKGSLLENNEHAIDMEAVRRGYGEGLIEYREWIYHTAPEVADRKRQIYMTPEEIRQAMAELGQN